jgi:uncharacterized low-complexity protein
MKKRMHVLALGLALVLAGAAFASPAQNNKMKESAAHKTAVGKCGEDYRMASKEAKMKKGTERKEAEAAAKQTRKQCIADAPK